VPGDHVGKKTDGQGEMFGDHADHFDRNHDEFEQKGDSRRAEGGEIAQKTVLAHPGYLDYEKGHQGEGRGDRDIACGRGAVRHQPGEVAEHDEEKGRQQIGGVRPAFMPEIGHDDVVADKNHQGLEGVRQSVRHQTRLAEGHIKTQDQKG